MTLEDLCSKCKTPISSGNLCYYCFDQEMSRWHGKPEETVCRYCLNKLTNREVDWYGGLCDPCVSTAARVKENQADLSFGPSASEDLWPAYRLAMETSKNEEHKKLMESVERLAKIKIPANKVELVDKMFDLNNKIQEEKCWGCQENYPLGSGRYHYGVGGDRDLRTNCTHDPRTGIKYEEITPGVEYRIIKGVDERFYLVNEKGNVVKRIGNFKSPGAKLVKSCDCGGRKCKTTCSDWCSTNK